MPARLYEMTSPRILKWFTTIALSEGVGLNNEQLTTRMSMSLGESPAQPQQPRLTPSVGRPGLGEKAHGHSFLLAQDIYTQFCSLI